MTKEVRMTKSPSAFVIRASSFIRHSSFVIRHFDHGNHRPTSKPESAGTPLPAGDPQRDGNHAPALQKHALRPDEGDDAIPGTEMGQPPAGALSRRARLGEGRD